MTSLSGGAPSPHRWQAIEETLQRALDLAPERRPAFLDQACAGDAELRREVESLLAADPDSTFLERPALAELRAPTGKHPAPPTPAPRSDEAHEIATRLSAAVADRYAVEGELGRGGMAVVFLARDLRHRRRVAMKVLYPELSAVLGTDRFLKEIELTASLQHPHILPLYDSGSADGLLFYVMPFVEGESLRTRLSRERHLPVADALRIAGEVANALAYAHARGVVHRDVKPENILLQGEHAVVADFGIALAVQQAGGERMTRTGLSLGTPQYMAPEQAMGDRVVDARADVYALGAVTYEMLAGEAPFAGPTAQAVVARVLTESAPPLAARRPSVPPHVDAAVRVALEKIPADRFAGASAFAAALVDPGATHAGGAHRATHGDRASEGAASARSSAARTPGMRASTGRSPALLLLGSLAAVAIGVAVERYRAGSTVPPPPQLAATGVMRFAIDSDSGGLGLGAPAISPDGRTLVYGGGARASHLVTRRLDELAPRAIKGSEYGESPFFSSDGAFIAYVAKGALWKVRLDAGTPALVTRLAGTGRFAGGTWGTDDVILFSTEPGELFRVSANGGTATRVPLADASMRLLHPRLLPGMRGALVTIARGTDPGRIGVLELASGRVHEFGVGAGARYASGQIVFARRGGEVFRQSFDLDAMRPRGSEVRLQQGVDGAAVGPVALAALFDVAPNGTLAYRDVSGAGDGDETRLVVTDRAGRVQRIVPSRVPWSPRLSPDGRRVAYGAFAPGRATSDLWITDLETNTTQQVTDDGGDSNDPRWSPDGRFLAYSALADDGKDLFVWPLDDRRARRLTSLPGSEWPSGWTSDGQQVVFTRWAGDDQRDVWLQPANGAAPRAMIATSAQETGGSVSPDRRWVIYQSDESGRTEVYVESFPSSGKKVRVSSGGGVNPMWRSDGAELYYWEEDRLIAVPVLDGTWDAPISLGPPTALFRASYTPAELPMYDASRDGTRFVLVARGVRAERLVVAVGGVGGG